MSSSDDQSVYELQVVPISVEDINQHHKQLKVPAENSYGLSHCKEHPGNDESSVSAPESSVCGEDCDHELAMGLSSFSPRSLASLKDHTHSKKSKSHFVAFVEDL